MSDGTLCAEQSETGNVNPANPASPAPPATPPASPAPPADKGTAPATYRPEPHPQHPVTTDSRQNRKWLDWEKGCLIDSVNADQSLEDVAAIVSRTMAAVRSEYVRLLDGSARCPAGYEDRLKRMQARRPKDSDEPGPRRGGKALGAVTEQYRALAQRLDRIEATLADSAAAMLVDMALGLASGTIQAALLPKFLSPKTARAVAALARDLAEGEIAGLEMPDLENIDESRDTPDSGDTRPLVVLGQGDCRREFHNSDSIFNL